MAPRHIVSSQFPAPTFFLWQRCRLVEYLTFNLDIWCKPGSYIEFVAGARPRLQSDCSQVPAGREEQGLAGCPVQMMLTKFQLHTKLLLISCARVEAGMVQPPPNGWRGKEYVLFTSKISDHTPSECQAYLSRLISGNCNFV